MQLNMLKVYWRRDKRAKISSKKFWYNTET